MNFTLLSPLGFLAGLSALAGGLFLLQRLRVRHREVDVVTTLFWHEAVHDARARVLVDRFRHPWAYALVLGIAALLWSAFAAPERDHSPESSVVLLLDASAAAGDEATFAATVAALEEQVRAFDKESREVLVRGTETSTLLRRGEEALLLSARLEEVAPVASPARIEQVLESLAREDRGPTRVIVFNRAQLDSDRIALLPEGFQVEQALLMAEGMTAASANSGVTALGLAEAESGAWDAVDVLVEVQSTAGPSSPLVLSVDGKVLDRTVQGRALANGATSYRVSDVPARGGRLEARISAGDASLFDDIASIYLPDRKPLRVMISSGIESELRRTLRLVLDSDPAIAIVESDAAIVIRTSTESVGAELPALVLSSISTQEESFLVTHDESRNSEAVLAEVAGSLALAQIDATSLADAVQAAITLGARGRSSGPREIAVWQELFGSGFDFTSSRAFPLFLGGSLRWLSGAEELRPWVAASETAIETQGLQRAGGRLEVPMAAAAIPSLAAEYTTQDGERLAASILSRETTSAGKVEALGDSEEDLIQVAAPALDPVTWILIAALLLLLFEWRQVRTGRMP